MIYLVTYRTHPTKPVTFHAVHSNRNLEQLIQWLEAVQADGYWVEAIR